MDAAKAIIVLWCPLSVNEKSYVYREEAPYALRNEKLLPVMIKHCKIPEKYEPFHTVKLVNWSRRASQQSREFASLITKLGKALGRELVLDAAKAKQIDEVLSKHYNPGHCEIFQDPCRLPVPSMVSVPDGHFEPDPHENEPEQALPPINSGWQEPRRIFFDTPFAVSCHPITVREFEGFVTATNKLEPPRGARVCINDRIAIWAEASWRNPGFHQTGDHPVTCVSWYEAKAYAGWLSEITGERYRLLSESEWEYAARARGKTAFCFGSTITSHQANFDSRVPYAGQARTWDYRRGTTAVGKFPRNAWGLLDIHGNVGEWCEDSWHESRTEVPQDGRAVTDRRRLGGPDDHRAVRGGAWRDAPLDLRCAARAVGHALERYNHIGFRVARDLPLLV